MRKVVTDNFYDHGNSKHAELTVLESAASDYIVYDIYMLVLKKKAVMKPMLKQLENALKTTPSNKK